MTVLIIIFINFYNNDTCNYGFRRLFVFVCLCCSALPDYPIDCCLLKVIIMIILCNYNKTYFIPHPLYDVSYKIFTRQRTGYSVAKDRHYSLEYLSWYLKITSILLHYCIL